MFRASTRGVKAILVSLALMLFAGILWMPATAFASKHRHFTIVGFVLHCGYVKA